MVTTEVLKKFFPLMLIMGLTVGAWMMDVGKMENTAGGPAETIRFTATR